jgi:hypothetical protein
MVRAWIQPFTSKKIWGDASAAALTKNGLRLTTLPSSAISKTYLEGFF